MPLMSVALLAAIFIGLPITLARIASSSGDATTAWPECYFVADERREDARVPRFSAGFPWSLTLAAAPLVMIALLWAIAAALEGKALLSAWLHGELGGPLVVALVVALARAIAASAASFGAFYRSGTWVLGGLGVGAALDIALLAIPIQVTSNPREDVAVALLSLGFTLATSIVYAIEDARRRDRAA